MSKRALCQYIQHSISLELCRHINVVGESRNLQKAEGQLRVMEEYLRIGALLCRIEKFPDLGALFQYSTCFLLADQQILLDEQGKQLRSENLLCKSKGS